MPLCTEAWKIQEINGIWTRYLAIPVRRCNQLSYEAADDKLVICGFEWAREEWMWSDIWNISYIELQMYAMIFAFMNAIYAIA